MAYGQNNNQGLFNGLGLKDNIVGDLAIIDILFLGLAGYGLSQVGNNKVLSDTDKGLIQNEEIIKQNDILIKQNEEILKLLKGKPE